MIAIENPVVDLYVRYSEIGVDTSNCKKKTKKVSCKTSETSIVVDLLRSVCIGVA